VFAGQRTGILEVQDELSPPQAGLDVIVVPKKNGVSIMKHRSTIHAVGILFLLFLLTPASAQQDKISSAPKDFLKVGKTYNFNTVDIPQDILTAEVLALPDANWVRVRLRKTGQEALLNLKYVKSIVSTQSGK
jgi:hypothetical protein